MIKIQLISIFILLNVIPINAQKHKSLMLDTISFKQDKYFFINDSNSSIKFEELQESNICVDSLLGHNVDEFKNIKFSGKFILTQVNQFERCFFALIDSIKYEIGVNVLNKINFISTNDKRFMLQKDIKIGTSKGELKNKVFNDGINEQGWGYYIMQKNGWCIGFNIRNNKIQDNDCITYFFRRY